MRRARGIEDFSSFGRRHARAEYKFTHCAQDAARTFCAQHADGSARDFKLHDQVDAAIRDKCVSLNSFYDNEPRTNQDPPGKINYANLPTSCPWPR